MLNSDISLGGKWRDQKNFYFNAIILNTSNAECWGTQIWLSFCYKLNANPLLFSVISIISRFVSTLQMRCISFRLFILSLSHSDTFMFLADVYNSREKGFVCWLFLYVVCSWNSRQYLEQSREYAKNGILKYVRNRMNSNDNQFQYCWECFRCQINSCLQFGFWIC